ncbi:hypothetical protein HCUR_00579 [Holospora curviuscula]|uniref:Uncharacterized protein n=2 Tax=Holospora curviuscula TaxID=1082868 RepID=A0A2S5R9P4_9PROT|nr:hypothetical protein HCUR_00579 [Holospora curviuscula]
MCAFHPLQKLLYVITIFGSSVLAENILPPENSVSTPNNLAAPLPLESNSETNSPPPDNETYEEEPLSKEAQQEKELYDFNAYFDNYMDPRPFVIGSTEFGT